MGEQPTVIEPNSDDIVLESTDVVVHESKPDKRLQATIVSAHDTDKSIDNIMVDAPEANKDAAWFALKEYLIKRFGHQRTRMIFRAYLDGVKPTMKKERGKFVWYFKDAEGEHINTYFVTLIELI